MRRLTTIVFATCLLLAIQTQALAQTTTPTDDEFNPAFIVLAVIFLVIMFGSIIIGAIVSAILLLLVFALVSAGILSTSLLVGLYKRSFSAGFKTFLVFSCAIAGSTFGALAIALINHFFHFHWNHPTTVLIGAGSGLAGGILLGLVVFSMIRLFVHYCRNRFFA